MYKVRVFLDGRELPTQQPWETKEKAEEMVRLYKTFFKAQGTKNFKFKITKIVD